MRLLILAFLCSVVSVITSCAYRVQYAPNSDTIRRYAEEDTAEQHIQIFFDGTSNDWSARTNVRRYFEGMANAENPMYPCVYIEGVGVTSLSGKAFGLGMKQRVLKAYCFLARHWSDKHDQIGQDNKVKKSIPRDKILIYGFSRGAFQARMLTGLLAHCGLPDATAASRKKHTDAELLSLAESVWEHCENHLKDPIEDLDGKRIKVTGKAWGMHLKSNQDQISNLPASKGWKFNYPDIDVLGIWDTVPGLPFAKLKDDGEVTPGEKQRYKVRPYPNIKLVIHALSLDEKRSQFHPLLVGPPIDDEKSDVYEVWFPGVHSDVGGGYRDSNDMAGTTLDWMEQVMLDKKVISKKRSYYADAHGVLHHPLDDFFSSIGSHSLTRKIPAGSQVDISLFKRANGEPHPEQGRSGGVKYQPTLEVVLEDRSTKTLTVPSEFNVDGKSPPGDFKPKSKADAIALLDAVGLKLYEPDGKLNQPQKGEALTLSQMDVPVTPSQAVIPRESPLAPMAPKQVPPNPVPSSR